MKQNQKRAFSIIELSIVILIVATIIAASIGVSKTILNNSKSKVTKDRMEAVYKAITNYVATNKKLPCPASLAIAKGNATYGTPAGNDGACAGAIISGNLAYGMVTTKILGLGDDMAEDGFGTKFSYVVDVRFTKASAGTAANDGFELTKSAPSEADAANINLSIIDVQGPAGTSLLPNKNAIFVLISHGANKFGGFNASSTTINSNGGTADETSNSSVSFDSTFISSSSSNNFDDIVIFKTKAQLVKDAGLEEIMCNSAEAQNNLCPDGVYNQIDTAWKSADYGTESCFLAGFNYCKKTCGKYGMWSNVQNGFSTCGSQIAPIAPIIQTCQLNNGYQNGNDVYNGSSLVLQLNESRSMSPTSGFCPPNPTLANNCLGDGTTPTITCTAQNTLTKTNGSVPCHCKITQNQDFGYDIYTGNTTCFTSIQYLTTKSGFCSQNPSPPHLYCNRTVSSDSYNKYNPSSGNFYPSRACYNCTAANMTTTDLVNGISGYNTSENKWSRDYPNECRHQTFRMAYYPVYPDLNHGQSASHCMYSALNTCWCGCTWFRYTSSTLTYTCNDGRYIVSETSSHTACDGVDTTVASDGGAENHPSGKFQGFYWNP